MVSINLLPWREKQARYEKRVLVSFVLGAVMGALFLLLVVSACLSTKQAALLVQIEQLNKELTWREGLASHTRQKSGATYRADEFFIRLNEVNAHEVCFEQIKKTKSGIELIGFSPTSAYLTRFLQTSTLGGYFAEVRVEQLQPQAGQLKFYLLGKAHAA